MPKIKRKTANGRKRVVKRYLETAREYEELRERLGMTQLETGQLFGFAGRTARRYKRGEGEVPLSALKLMRLMASGVVSKGQIKSA